MARCDFRSHFRRQSLFVPRGRITSFVKALGRVVDGGGDDDGLQGWSPWHRPEPEMGSIQRRLSFSLQSDKHLFLAVGSNNLKAKHGRCWAPRHNKAPIGPKHCSILTAEE